MRVRTGTSGYSYKEWKGVFYPERIKPAEMLAFYAGRISTCEINNTFYRMPREEVVRNWVEQTPEDFSLVLKATRRITHSKKLEDAGEETAHLLRVTEPLGAKRGPMLFQLPPWAKRDLDALRELLDLLPDGFRAAFEFRNPSWTDEAVYETLRGRDMAWVVSDRGSGDDAECVATAGWGYLRLRRDGYDEAALTRWAARIRETGWNEAWVFFKHEDKGVGPKLVGEFDAIWNQV